MERKNYELRNETTLEEMQEMITAFTYSARCEYDGMKNEDLVETCTNIADRYYDTFRRQYKIYNKSRIENKIYSYLPDYFAGKEPRIIFDEAITKVLKDIDFEKGEVKDIKKYIKLARKKQYYDDLPLVYCILVGIGKMHVSLNNYLQMEGDLLYNRLNRIGYIPAKNYELPSEEYKDTIAIAINKVYGMEIPEFQKGNNGKNKIK